ncbi:MAG: phosphate ABC transporter ATP-binding protein [Rhizobiales bacterium 17-65-6]|nr:MAG: phosphate ABC transporter ATP-binding protein [Rhizobiales bacterium 17-65-6]
MSLQLSHFSLPTTGAHRAMPPSGPLVEKLHLHRIDYLYGHRQALFEVSLPIFRNRTTALIGPSGCGKSTLLRVLNRMYELYHDQTVTGSVLMDGQDILSRRLDPIRVRTRIGMVAQKPTPFPMSVFDNVALGVRLNEDLSPRGVAERVEWALNRAALWDEVKDRLRESALGLSGGQQQRLCIARTLAVKPEVILLDEPCSALDPLSTARIEDTMDELKQDHTLIIVTHNMQQAARVSDFTAFMYLGRLIEFGPTAELFTTPQDERTLRYVTGRFG